MVRWIWVAALGAAFLTSGCGGVEFYQKRQLAEPVMNLDDGAAEAHFYRKVYYSREAAAGGIGTGAGGGCGCY